MTQTLVEELIQAGLDTVQAGRRRFHVHRQLQPTSERHFRGFERTLNGGAK